MPCNIKSSICRRIRFSFCSAAAIARPTPCRKKLGGFSRILRSARPTRTAAEAYAERRGVCRDFAHLAIAFCRCLNIPARYCTGYVSDIGIPPPYSPMDFAAWMEVYLGGRWFTFDPRNNAVRFGRILIAQGRDAADVPLTLIFGPGTLSSLDGRSLGRDGSWDRLR